MESPVTTRFTFPCFRGTSVGVDREGSNLEPRGLSACRPADLALRHHRHQLVSRPAQ